jgi:hypothetical protein
MVVRLKLKELRRGLKVVLVCSSCLLASLISCFMFVAKIISITMPNWIGLAIVMAVASFVVYVGAYAFHVLVDSAFILMDSKYLVKRGLKTCA